MKFTLTEVKKLVKEAAAEDVSTGNEYLDNIYEVEVPKIIGHTSPYYIMWYLLAETLKPSLVVELGSWRAFGAAHFAVGNSKGKVVTIDIHKDSQPCHEKAVEVAGHFDNLDFIHKWTWDAAQDVAKYGPIDILFIDAWHEYEYVMREWKLYEPLLADEALVICDDLFDSAGTTIDMVKFWTEISEGYDKFVDTSLHGGIPMGYFHYKRPGTEAKSKATTTQKPKK